MLAALRRVVARIPRGKVATYGGVAKAAGLPWHRMLGAGGRILLPGAGALEQRMRLEQEGVEFRGGRVVMERCEAKTL